MSLDMTFCDGKRCRLVCGRRITDRMRNSSHPKLNHISMMAGRKNCTEQIKPSRKKEKPVTMIEYLLAAYGELP